MTTWQDWVLGNGQNVGLPSPQYAQAVNLAKQVEAVYGDNLDRGANPNVADSTRRTFREVVNRAKLPPNSPSAAAHAEVVKRLDTLIEHP